MTTKHTQIEGHSYDRLYHKIPYFRKSLKKFRLTSTTEALPPMPVYYFCENSYYTGAIIRI